MSFFWDKTKTNIKELAYQAYEKRLETKMPNWVIPKHVGIIMDGNRRFARMTQAGVIAKGHQMGADKLDEVLSWCEEAGVEVVTVWGFSVDNFQRSEEEVKALMELFEERFTKLVTDKRIHRDKIRIRSIGQIELLPKPVQEAIRKAEKATEHYDRRFLNIGIAYGGREEIVDAMRRYLEDEEKAGHDISQAAEKLSVEELSQYVYASDAPDPELIIRTSGEVRTSGFLLWQSAHSEYYFCEANWPAFRKIDFLRALRSFHKRKRRFGR